MSDVHGYGRSTYEIILASETLHEREQFELAGA